MFVGVTRGVEAKFIVPMYLAASPALLATGKTLSITGFFSDAGGAWTTLGAVTSAEVAASMGAYQITLSATQTNHDRILLKIETVANDVVEIIVEVQPRQTIRQAS